MRRRLTEMRYTRMAGVRLNARIFDIAQETANCVELYDELALARALIGDVLELRTKIEDKEDLSEEKKLAALTAINEKIVAHLRQIEALAVATAKLEAAYAMDAKTLQAVVVQVAEMVDDELSKVHAESGGAIDVGVVGKRLADRIKSDIIVPDHEQELVKKLPSGELVDLMDNSIPEPTDASDMP